MKELVIIAHNIRSLWNVGSLFRSADAFGITKIYLTGYTGTPPRREISKTALGAEQWIDWEYEEDPHAVIAKLKSESYVITALELTDDAININDYKVPNKLCLVLGHEVTGVSEELLQQCDEVVFIPMHGKKESINVSVAAGIAMQVLMS